MEAGIVRDVSLQTSYSVGKGRGLGDEAEEVAGVVEGVVGVDGEVVGKFNHIAATATFHGFDALVIAAVFERGVSAAGQQLGYYFGRKSFSIGGFDLTPFAFAVELNVSAVGQIYLIGIVIKIFHTLANGDVGEMVFEKMDCFGRH